MHRRQLLRTGLGAGIVGVAGCLGNIRPPGTEAGPDRSEWASDVIGDVAAVSNGRVLGYEDYQTSDGGIFALDIETGEHLWSFGRSGPFSSNSGMAVDDAIYFGTGDDAIGSGDGELYALEFDGTERWARETGSVYDAPIVLDETVYVTGDDTTTRAFETRSGSERWSTPIPDAASYSKLLAATDTLYLEADILVALEPASGDVRWTYDRGGNWSWDVVMSGDVAFATGEDGVIAVTEGELHWEAAYDELGGRQTTWLPTIEAVESDRLFVRIDDRLVALSAENGDMLWTIEQPQAPIAAPAGEVVYAAGPSKGGLDELRAVDASDGTVHWSRSLEHDDRFPSIEVIDGHLGDDHAVFVADSTTIARFDSEGEKTWTRSPGEGLGGYVVDEFVYLGTKAGVRAFDPR